MAGGERYDTLGVGYAQQRRADPRIAAQIRDALGDAERILNVGAGTGNYEPEARLVVGVEPSVEMIRQRTVGHPAVQAEAEALPFQDDSFDAVLAMFTVHHWSDRTAGLHEVCRVAPRHVLLVYEPIASGDMWLVECFPGIAAAPWAQDVPTVESLAKVLDVRESQPVRIPADCTDGFTGAYWCRPHYYLRPEVHASISSLAILDPSERAVGMAKLAADLESGAWDERYGHLRSRSWFDVGYRLAICGRR